VFVNVNDGPDVIEQLPAGGNVMTPPSGSYGSKVENQRLRKSLQVPEGPVTPTPSQPSPVPGGGPSGMPSAPAAPGTVPDVLMRPTNSPDTPVSKPLAGRGGMSPAAAVDAAQKRLQLLDFLSTSDDVSPETQEWAQMVRDALAARSA
tara:strand:+ start:5038 stop:5481 length:444 start_codon:yes stop_codon:yes gene_type:complete